MDSIENYTLDDIILFGESIAREIFEYQNFDYRTPNNRPYGEMIINYFQSDVYNKYNDFLRKINTAPKQILLTTEKISSKEIIVSDIYVNLKEFLTYLRAPDPEEGRPPANPENYRFNRRYKPEIQRYPLGSDSARSIANNLLREEAYGNSDVGDIHSASGGLQKHMNALRNIKNIYTIIYR